MSVYNYDTLKEHANHEIEIVTYGPSSREILNIALECVDCNETLVSFDDDGDEEAIGETKCDFWTLRAHLNHRLICEVNLSSSAVNVYCLDCAVKVLKFSNEKYKEKSTETKISGVIEFLNKRYLENDLSIEEVAKNISLIDFPPITGLTFGDLILAYSKLAENLKASQTKQNEVRTLPFVCLACHTMSQLSSQILLDRNEAISCPACKIVYHLSESKIIYFPCCGEFGIPIRDSVETGSVVCPYCGSWFQETIKY